jgi:hypothetical protein
LSDLLWSPPVCAHFFLLLLLLFRRVLLYLFAVINLSTLSSFWNALSPSSLSSDQCGCDCSSLIWSVHLLRLEERFARYTGNPRLVVGDWDL